jgi:fructose-bisphosphate aldolase / 2-amino-3,7-dideoxy-D-threo-hept-6-ulosonate synthase
MTNEGKSMNTGKQIRLNKLWKHDRTLIIPFDHGLHSGAVEGLEVPERLAEIVADSPADGILVTPGVLRKIAPIVKDLGIMLRIDGAFTSYTPDPGDFQSLYGVDDALSLGADSVIVMTYVGTPYEQVSLTRLGQTAADGDRFGMPVASEILPPALLENHFGRDMGARFDQNEDIVDQIMHASRIGMEHGADLIKTRYHGNPESYKKVIATAGVPVIVAGGPKKNDTDKALLQLVHDIMQTGAAGIVFGRNVWKHPKVDRIIRAIAAIVHENESVTGALKILK